MRRRRARHCARLALLGVLLGATVAPLAGCGQPGPLYLPDVPPPPAQAASAAQAAAAAMPASAPAPMR